MFSMSITKPKYNFHRFWRKNNFASYLYFFWFLELVFLLIFTWFLIKMYQTLFWNYTKMIHTHYVMVLLFHQIAYRLWTIALVDTELLNSLLNCFINFSADTVKTAKAIVTCHQAHQSSNQPPSIGSTQSLIENICRLTSADISAIHLRETTVKLIFRLLSNLVWCPEGVNLLLRVSR